MEEIAREGGREGRETEQWRGEGSIICCSALRWGSWLGQGNVQVGQVYRVTVPSWLQHTPKGVEITIVIESSLKSMVQRFDRGNTLLMLITRTLRSNHE